MDNIISVLQTIVHHAAEIGIIIAEVIGIAILIITAVKCFVKYFRKDDRVRLELAQGIALALEFKLGGEVLHTVTVSQDDWTALLFLGGIIALRGVLTLLLHWEIKIEEDKEKLEMLDQQNDIMAEQIARQKAEATIEAEEAAQK